MMGTQDLSNEGLQNTTSKRFPSHYSTSSLVDGVLSTANNHTAQSAPSAGNTFVESTEELPSPFNLPMNSSLSTDPDILDSLDQTGFHDFLSGFDDHSGVLHSLTPSPSINPQFPPQPFSPSQPPDLIPQTKPDITRDQIRQQIENDIQRELKQAEIMHNLQEMQRPIPPDPSMFTTQPIPPAGYDSYSADMRAAAYRANGIPPPSDQYDELLRAWVKEKGMDINAARKRKSEDMSDAQPSFTMMKPMVDTDKTYTKSVQLNTTQPSKTGDFDLFYAKSQIVDLFCGESSPTSFATKITNFLCGFMHMKVGGFYINQRPNPKDWTLGFAFPSTSAFDTYFQFNVGFHLILQAATEKRCFCVHSTSLTTGSLSFIFVPLPPEDMGTALGVIVLGTILQGEEDLHSHLVFLDHIRRPISQALNTIASIHSNAALTQRLEYIRLENEVLKQKNRFERALISVITSCGPVVSDATTLIIVTELSGVIQYFSSGANQILGYTSTELVGRYTPTMLHEPSDLFHRSQELEGPNASQKMTGFSLIVEPILRTGKEETRDWVMLRKEGTTVVVTITTRPLYDEEDKSLIGFLEVGKLKGEKKE